MKLYKNILLITALILLAVLPVCSAQQPSISEVKQYADPMTENILLAMNEDNYSRFSQDFDEQMKNGLNEAHYCNTIPLIKSRIGEYITKELISVGNKDEYIIATYKASFSGEPGTAIVTSVFSDKNGKKYVSGFWIDSPKLRSE